MSRPVANPPQKPLLLFDGHCHFCRRWIERWRVMTADRVDYETAQEAGARFPELAPSEFERAVQLIEPDGQVFSGAEAVCRSLGHARGGSYLKWCYEHVPGFAAGSELAYTAVAKNRRLASLGTRLLWGNDVRPPTYVVARGLFLRALGAIFLIAFLSLWTQVDGLVGSNGISPVQQFLPMAQQQLGAQAPFVLPTLCWLNSSDTFLHLLCGTGVLFSCLLMIGLLPAVSLLVLYVCYLSLTVAGQAFLNFQWDILLLETGFLGIFFAPWTWRIKRDQPAPVSRLGLFLLKLLLFKLMFLSGLVKLTSGDDSWLGLIALNYHYETQPLPTVIGWWAQQGPDWLKRFGVAFALFVELAVPFLIWMPRRPRLIGCALLIALQVIIALTGNYAFFNLLTIALCLLLVDDAVWRRDSRRQSVAPQGFGTRCSVIASILVLVIVLPIDACFFYSAFKPEAVWPRPVAALQSAIGSFNITNSYGLFRVMTRSRPEIVLEGSADGIDWVPYKFKWKPGDLDKPPRWVAPHQPRLDWQMWFAALGSPRNNPWFYGLCESLLTNSPPVIGLLAENPFPQKPPRFVRAILYHYHFASSDQHRASGAWWKREEKSEYLRPISLRED